MAKPQQPDDTTHFGYQSVKRDDKADMVHESDLALHSERLVVPGDPGASRLYKIITDTADPPVRIMEGKFSDEDREVVRDWIDSLPTN